MDEIDDILKSNKK